MYYATLQAEPSLNLDDFAPLCDEVGAGGGSQESLFFVAKGPARWWEWGSKLGTLRFPVGYQ